MNESKLLKDWKDNDVQRMRNIINKNYNDKTKIQIGYNKIDIDRKEGDVWEENDKQWTIKNGIKQNITKTDILRKLTMFPITCPKCEKYMDNTKLNKKMYFIHNMCFDCVIKLETKLKFEGLFEEYQKNINNQGLEFYIKELENLLLDLSMDNFEESFTTESGDIETWKSNNSIKEKLIKDIQEYILKLKDIKN